MFDKYKANKVIIKDISDNKTFSLGTYGVLFIVSFVMTVMNIFTDKGFLTYCTGIFAGLCLLNIFLTFLGNIASSIAKFLFAVEVIVMFSFFLVSGNPDGFSAIWICMLPSLGMIFFDRFKGSLLCIAMFIIMVFFLWIPYGQQFLMYEYTGTFKMRFPVLFLAFHMLAYLLETLRIRAYKEMHRMQEFYHDLSDRDQLTRVLNRQGMYSVLETDKSFLTADKISIAMFDIDDFKKINDKFGHNIGDIVLSKIAETISSSLNATVCRWGGEEFVAIFVDDFFDISSLEKARHSIEKNEFYGNGERFFVTVSIGVHTAEDINLKRIDSLIEKADEALYKAKNTGKNRIVIFDDLFESGK